MQRLKYMVCLNYIFWSSSHVSVRYEILCVCVRVCFLSPGEIPCLQQSHRGWQMTTRSLVSAIFDPLMRHKHTSGEFPSFFLCLDWPQFFPSLLPSAVFFFVFYALFVHIHIFSSHILFYKLTVTVAVFWSWFFSPPMSVGLSFKSEIFLQNRKTLALFYC